MSITQYKKKLESLGYIRKRINGDYYALKNNQFFIFDVDWLGESEIFSIDITHFKKELQKLIYKAFKISGGEVKNETDET